MSRVLIVVEDNEVKYYNDPDVEVILLDKQLTLDEIIVIPADFTDLLPEEFLERDDVKIGDAVILLEDEHYESENENEDIF